MRNSVTGEKNTHNHWNMRKFINLISVSTKN